MTDRFGVRYQSRDFHPDRIVKRYACYGLILNDLDRWRGFTILDVATNGYTIRETVVDRSELPPDIAEQCIALDGHWPKQVELP